MIGYNLHSISANTKTIIDAMKEMKRNSNNLNSMMSSKPIIEQDIQK